jgi:inosine-uridine nucleoside N-ribohydrolase
MKQVPFQLTIASTLLSLWSMGANLQVQKPFDPPSKPIKVILDTDIAEDIDDILVTAFAISAPEFQVLAITVVDGGVEARSRVARKVAKLYGQPGIPVAKGYSRSMPLTDQLYPGHTGGVRYGEVATDESELPAESPLKADALIARLADQYPGEVNLLTVGSMSNVGHLLVRYPESAKKLKRIITNGGRFVNLDDQSIGWNLRYDPVAATLTQRSEIPWVLLSETSSRFASPREEDVTRIDQAGLPTTDLLTDAIRWWRTNKTDASRLPHVSDLNVFAYLLGLVEVEKGNAYLEIGPKGKLPGFRVEADPKGKILFGNIIPKEKAEALRAYMIERLLAPPTSSLMVRIVRPNRAPRRQRVSPN